MSERKAEATSIGAVAARALREGAGGTVRCLFERSLYLTLGDPWLCLGPQSLGAGPLNVLCAPARGDAAWPVRQDDPAGVRGNVLRIGDTLAIEIGAATVWSSSPPSGWGRETLLRGLAAFDAALPSALPRDGLALLLRPPDDDAALPAVAKAARAPAGAMIAMVCERHRGSHRPLPAEPLLPLLGLGPGLTPSGDDFLGGAMVALTYLGMTPLRDEIWKALAPPAATRTNDISRAHLAATAEGLGSAALHDLLDAVVAGRTTAVPACTAALARVGHTSGWDAMAGAITVLRAAGNL